MDFLSVLHTSLFFCDIFGIMGDHSGFDLPDGQMIKQLVKCRAYLSAEQANLNNGETYVVQLDSEDFDTGADFNVANYRFTAPVSGYYLVCARVTYHDVSDAGYLKCFIREGSDNNISQAFAQPSRDTEVSVYLLDVLYLTAAQYIELMAEHTCGNNLVDISGTSPNTFMSVFLISG